jgi:hypothetical protein
MSISNYQLKIAKIFEPHRKITYKSLKKLKKKAVKSINFMVFFIGSWCKIKQREGVGACLVQLPGTIVLIII